MSITTKTYYQVPEVNLSYSTNFKVSERPIINSSSTANDIFLAHWDLGSIEFIEEFKILLLNRANRVLGIFNASSGSMTNAIADPRVIFTAALKAAAPVIILAHNHPSGKLQPSQADINLTKRLTECGTLLGVEVVDHLIITNEGYYSFADEGLL
ncbi:JAB domain-containing protein [Mucilaginibacter sp. UYCu711]|uniref:JAB domain-containing protein n=1 Tax=Mucilaginibacter sp. UYCu711 TaxID=3156339 RepID=UPI003D1BDF8A